MPTYAAQAAAVPSHFGAISLSAAAVLLTFAVLLKWKPLRRAEFLIPWLCLAAGIGLAAAFLLGWAKGVTGLMSSIVPFIGPAVPWIAACVFGYILCYDLWPRHLSNNLTAFSALIFPSVAPTVGGVVGTAFATALSTIAVAAATALATLFGV